MHIGFHIIKAFFGSNRTDALYQSGSHTHPLIVGMNHKTEDRLHLDFRLFLTDRIFAAQIVHTHSAMFIGIAPANNFIAAVCKIPPDTTAFYIYYGTGSPFFPGIKPMTGTCIGVIATPCNAIAFHLVTVDVMGSYIEKVNILFCKIRC